MARRISIISLVILAVIQTAMADVPSANEFFKTNINGNLTKITWKHAVNSKTLLTDALASATMMLEADVVLGNLTNSNTTKIPIMAHPPNEVSDLSLDEFLTVVLKNRTKGIKLDFKSIEAYKAGLEVLEKHKSDLTVPLWLNADILLGPVNATVSENTKPVNAKEFLEGAKKTVSQSTLSVGWVTSYKTNSTGNYTSAHIEEMLKTLKDSNVTQTVTYPVRAAFAMNSIDTLKTLLEKSSNKNATLTIWSAEEDVVDGKKLSKLINEVGAKKVYVDVPEKVWKTLDLSKSGASYAPASIVLSITSMLAVTFTTRML